MGSSSQHLFDPECPSSGHALRVWVDSYRAEGADWRDERPLSPAAVQELRRWDRLLKAWARIRFEPQASTDPHPIVHHLPPAPQDDLRPVRLQFERMSMATPPITPHYVRTAAINPVEVVPFPSPISPDASAYNIASPIIATPSTSTAADSSRSAWIKPPLSGLVRRVDARKPMAEVSINRVGDTINITVPTVAIPETPRGVDECFSGRDVARGDQENVYPPSKRTPAHASTTAKSWRTGSQDDAGEQSAMDERVVAFRMAAKSLFAGGSKEDGMIGVATPTTPHRPDMDWGKLRRNQVVNKTVLPTGGNDSVENA